MTTIYLATGDVLAIVRRRGEGWRVTLALEGSPTQCVAIDPLRPERVNCGTFGRGLWRSEDAGASWRPAGEGIPHAENMSVAVSRAQRTGDHGVLWVGAEPSAVFRSEDGGQTWVERPALRDLPSAPTWSFPPRPWTHHVRWIAPDAVVPERLFVGIELGGVMRSLDGGRSWEDRKPRSQHDPSVAESTIYRRSGDGPWEEVREGLPSPRGKRVAVVAANEAEPRVFYATRDAEIYRSADAGRTWERPSVTWPNGYRPPAARGMVVAEN